MNHQSSNNQQQQQQSKSVGIVSEKASDSYLQQQQQKPRVSNQNISIISLSKLKNYMPQSQLAAAAAAARLFPASSQQARRQTHSLAAGYRSDLAAPDQSSLCKLFNVISLIQSRGHTFALTKQRFCSSPPHLTKMPTY